MAQFIPIKKKIQPLETSQGLYQLAQTHGLGADADRIMAQQSGEETKKIFSGGFISDVFDVLNTLQYGVTGILKGKSFLEGVKTRQSFSDKDALGEYGLPGVIGGIALDIAVDPLTYIAPATILRKIPGATKLAKVSKEAVFGKMTEKTIETAGKTINYQELEGGHKLGKWLADKFSYMFGVDPVYRNSWEKMTRNIGQSTMNLVGLTKGVAKIEPSTAAKILTKDITGRFKRVPLTELQKVLKPQELEPVAKLYTKLDELGKEAVNLGLLSKTKYEENLGEYIKNAYTEYEQVKNKSSFAFMKTGVKGIQKRVEGLTPEKMKELGQIDNPAYLLFKSTFDLQKDIENTKLFNSVAEKFGSEVAQEGFKQLPTTRRLFTTATGEKIKMFSQIKNLNQKLKPVLRELKSTFKADRATLSEIFNLEKNLNDLSKTRSNEFYKFFQAGQKVIKEIPQKGFKTGVPLAEKLPQELFNAAEKIKRDRIDRFELENFYESGLLERNGFKSIKSFIDYVKKPAQIIPEKITESVLKGNIPKLIAVQSQIEKLIPKLENLKGVNKASVNDSFINLERIISNINAEKEGIFEQIGKVKLGELSGKFVPENIWKQIQQISEPFKDTIGNKLVASFKYNKVILNPATHARNIMSNTILNWWKLGLGPWRADIYGQAVKEVTRGGKWLNEAKTVGYNIDTFATNELKSLLNSSDARKFSNQIGGKYNNIKNKLADVYQGEENIAKMAAFIHQRGKGLNIEDAWKAAESATFNYAQVTPFIRKLRTSLFGYPFATFSFKSAPIVAETALKHPGRISVFGKIKNDIENASDIKETDREKASEPPWVKDGFYIKLPMKDKEGRSAYFDLTYIIPFGDLISGNLFARQINRETGVKESMPSALASNAPIFNLIKELSRNQDFYDDKIWQDTAENYKQLGDIMRYLSKTILPPLVADQIPGGWTSKGTRRQKGFVGALTPQDKADQQRTLMQEMLRNVGAKVQPVDADIQESMQERNKKKALQTLLLEKEILQPFSTVFTPKK